MVVVVFPSPAGVRRAGGASLAYRRQPNRRRQQRRADRSDYDGAGG